MCTRCQLPRGRRCEFAPTAVTRVVTLAIPSPGRGGDSEKKRRAHRTDSHPLSLNADSMRFRKSCAFRAYVTFNRHSRDSLDSALFEIVLLAVCVGRGPYLWQKPSAFVASYSTIDFVSSARERDKSLSSEKLRRVCPPLQVSSWRWGRSFAAFSSRICPSVVLFPSGCPLMHAAAWSPQGVSFAEASFAKALSGWSLLISKIVYFQSFGIFARGNATFPSSPPSELSTRKTRFRLRHAAPLPPSSPFPLLRAKCPA